MGNAEYMGNHTPKMGAGKPRGIRCARKLRTDRRNNRWADKKYKLKHLGTALKCNPFAGSSHAKGIVVEKIGIEAKQPNSAIRKSARVQLIITARRSPPSCHVMVALTSLRRTTKCSSLASVVPATLREIFPAFALRSPRSQVLVSGPSSARRRRSHVPKQSVDRQVFLLIWCA